MSEAFLARVKEYQRLSEASLRAVLERTAKASAGLPFGIERYEKHLHEYTLRGGKRLRGALVTAGFEALGGGDWRAAVEPSLSFELVHAFLLAYDDIMDRDELRRGAKALHVLMREEAARAVAPDPGHRGLSMTLLYGMSLQYVAFGLLARAPNAERTLAYMNEVMAEVTIGQVLDVAAADAHGATLAEQAEIQRRKTGIYTTEGPVVLGALLAGASRDDVRVKALVAWAGPLGEAFQMVDDLLGVLGDPAQTGKPAASDLREGKRTAVIEEALRRTSGSDHATLAGIVGRAATEAEAQAAKAIIVASGAERVIRERATTLAATANRALETAEIDAGARAFLSALASYIVEREN